MALHKIETITDVRFYDALGVELLHMPDPQFEGKQLKFPNDDFVMKKATYMVLYFEDGTDERVNFDAPKE